MVRRGKTDSEPVWERPDFDSIETLDVDKISSQHDTETQTRSLTGYWATLFTVVAVASSLFHFYTAGYRPLPAMEQRPIHLAFMLFLCFLLFPATNKGRGRNPTLIDLGLGIVAAVSSYYLAHNYLTIVLRGGWATTTDIIMGTILCLAILEACRRTIGMFLIVLSVLFTGYLFLGPYLPGILGHGGFSYTRIIRQLYMSTEGLYGIAVGVSATYVYLFILFGAFLQKSGTTTFFTNIAFAAAGHSPGGPAKVAILASGMMGMIQGSSAANVATTGLFTIPLMKKLGFRGYFAAAVEAVSSCGGQFLPPIMGASAFIMAEYLQMPYSYIAAGAILPAALYYGAVFLQVHLRARKLGMEGIDRKHLPKVGKVIMRDGHLVLPLFVLIGMLIFGFTALFAAFFSILSVIVISSMRKHSRMGIRDMVDALEAGARNTISTAVACAAVGFIVGSVGLSGIGLLFTQQIINLSGGELLPALLLAAACSLLLSFGLPTTSVYIITATLVAPSLVQLGVAPLVAHLFCYYWGGVSAITPPVALAAYVAAGIAGSPIMKTGFTAMRLGIAAYLVPFIFVYWPSLILWWDASLLQVAVALGGGIIAIICVSAMSERYFTRMLSWWKLAILGLTVILVLHPSAVANGLAVISAGLLLGSEVWATRGKAIPQAVPESAPAASREG
ncbi:TRAP transporter permease [Fodinicurvata sp. EGI_FJ10296]|uniref:TRAP transporter permease n=1 Tax=Fodinicurvata sp. EGI_FJ10296 TaxID=3231908 RepID=UPI00345153DA